MHVKDILVAGFNKRCHCFFRIALFPGGENPVHLVTVRVPPAPRDTEEISLTKYAENTVNFGVPPVLVIIHPDLLRKEKFTPLKFPDIGDSGHSILNAVRGIWISNRAPAPKTPVSSIVIPVMPRICRSINSPWPGSLPGSYVKIRALSRSGIPVPLSSKTRSSPFPVRRYVTTISVVLPPCRMALSIRW